MSKQFEDNRRLVWELINARHSFTTEEIILDYKAIRGNAIIDGFESIRGFLRGLEELGTLKTVHGQYVIKESTTKDLATC